MSPCVCATEAARTDHDPTGRRTYADVCEKLGIIPVSYFVRHITDPEVVMRYHGLGPDGTKAIAKVLKVRGDARAPAGRVRAARGWVLVLLKINEKNNKKIKK